MERGWQTANPPERTERRETRHLSARPRWYHDRADAAGPRIKLSRQGPCEFDVGRSTLDVRRLARLMSTAFQTNEEFALQLDADDPLRHFRERFHLPVGPDGKPLIYFVGNSLGLMPKTTRALVEAELDDWAKLGVDAHLEGGTPWYSYHETVREPAARIVGARPNEVVCMNSLTVNLHLMMATFYRPTKSRFKILIEDPAFPSDTYAVKTQIVHHGLEPKDTLVLARPRDREATLRTADVINLIENNSDTLALVLIGA